MIWHIASCPAGDARCYLKPWQKTMIQAARELGTLRHGTYTEHPGTDFESQMECWGVDWADKDAVLARFAEIELARRES